jgi:hypothetical protein
MVLDAAFTDLSAKLHRLREAFEELRIAAVEERPARGDIVLVDLYGDAADELLGCVEEALAAAGECSRAVSAAGDLERARRSLAAGHQQFNRINQRFTADLTRYERVADLAGVGRRRGREWGLWALNVKAALDRCQDPIFNVNEAYLACWQEIAERVAQSTISVHAVGIGSLVDSREAGQPAAASQGATMDMD